MAALPWLPGSFARPEVLLALPVLVAALWYLIVRPTGPSGTGRRPRYALLGSRIAIAACLVIGAAGPYTVAVRATPGEPRVHLLVDRSNSVAPGSDVAARLERAIEAEGVPARTTTIATGNTSRIGDGIVANIRPGGTVVVVSDGRVTGGRSLSAAAELARSVNATVSAVPRGASRPERHVALSGPGKTSVGARTRLRARVGGANIGDSTARVTITVDGTRIASERVTGEGTVGTTYRFNDTGAHRVVARVEGGPGYDVNDVAYRSVRVVEAPRILYVSRGEFPLRSYLDRLYNVTAARSVPADLSPYYAVVLQDVPARDLGRVGALQRFVVEGNGLVVVGGEHAYGRGGYANSTLASMLPVKLSPPSPDRANIVLAIDVSASTRGGMAVQKALALDVLNQLGDRNAVGLVAFNRQAYRIAPLTPLATGRSDLEEKIRRLSSAGGTDLAAGLRGAARALGDREGTIILISDGRAQPEPAVSVARELADRTRVLSVGVGPNLNDGLLRRVAILTGGTYFAADETDRLRILFGGEDREYEGSELTVVDGEHFITSGVRTTATLSRTHAVSVKEGADYLVAAGGGGPAVAAWRYGLGRVVSVTAYGAAGGLDGLLSPPDSLLTTKAVNWAIGDPQRKASGVVEVADARVGEPTTVTYRGAERPEAPGLTFRRVGEGTYRATVVPAATGFQSVLGAEYAANYPREYGAVGPAPELEAAVAATGGRVFAPDEGAAIAAFARQRARERRRTRTEWGWAFLLAGLALFLIEVAARRLSVYRGTGAVP